MIVLREEDYNAILDIGAIFGGFGKFSFTDGKGNPNCVFGCALFLDNRLFTDSTLSGRLSKAGLTVWENDNAVSGWINTHGGKRMPVEEYFKKLDIRKENEV